MKGNGNVELEFIVADFLKLWRSTMIHYFGGRFKIVSQSAMLAVALGTALFFLDRACCCWFCSAAAAAAALFFSRLSSSRKSLVLTYKDKTIKIVCTWSMVPGYQLF